MSRAARAAGIALGMALALPLVAGAEVRRVEALGAAPIDPEAPGRGAPRDRAMQQALHEAVLRVAVDELSGPGPGEEAVAAALGGDPLEYASRFRILEDRGERPALFSDDPEADTEYVVLVEVYVDAARVRTRLTEAGLVARPSGERHSQRVRLVIEDLDDFPAYRAVQDLLAQLGVRSAVPVEFERGRAVLEVEGSRDARGLVAALVRSAPPELRLEPLGGDAQSARLRARLRREPPAADAFDTP